MKNKTLLISIILICSVLGVAAYYLLDVASPARAYPERGRLDRLLDDLQVSRIPDETRPVEFRLPDASGTIVDIADFRGKIVFLNFWATWCPSCVTEMPAMEKLHRKLKDRDFAMVTVSIQDSADAVEGFFKQNELTYTALLDLTGKSVPDFGIRAIPTTLILDKTGRIIGRVMGPRAWDSRKALAMFEHLIGEPVANSTLTPAEPG
jgi:peroxiredoxin